jgi:hypothetical protein
MTGDIIHESRELGEFLVELNYDEKKGQVLLWMPCETHKLHVIAKNGDRDCVLMQMFQDPEKAKETYNGFKTEQNVKELLQISGFGRSCV